MALSLFTIWDFIGEEKNLIKKGELKLKASHIKSFKKSNDCYEAQIAASMKKKIYKNEVKFV